MAKKKPKAAKISILERASHEDEDRVPKQSDKGAPLVCLVAQYEDGSSIIFAADTKAVRRASKVKKGSSDKKKK